MVIRTGSVWRVLALAKEHEQQHNGPSMGLSARKIVFLLSVLNNIQITIFWLVALYSLLCRY
jgi:hypothetical protein